MWFNSDDIKIHDIIELNNLHGYVLPHAGTTHTGDILSHTLRFRPQKKFKNILILYLPSNSSPNVGKYYHEYYVIYKTLQKIFPNKKYLGFNLTSKYNPDISKLNKHNTLYIVSADFSHFLPLNEAIEKENCAAHGLVLKKLNNRCNSVVDHILSFKKLYKLLPNINLQWVGRTRSSGEKGVGYLSFLIRDKPNLKTKIPDGFFVTVYDKDLRQRECLGNTNQWTKKLEIELIKKVLLGARNSSRLTNGQYLDIPVTNYIVTYLYKDESKEFIRGWHSILMNALYLFDVFLENTYDNGNWINHSDRLWESGNIFNLEPTKQKLLEKASKFGNYNKNTNYQLYTNEIKCVSLVKPRSKKNKLLGKVLTKDKTNF